MKVCPRCQKTYTDDNLNFCLEDGSVLQQAAAPPPTVQMSAPQVSHANQQMPTQPSAQAGWNVPPQGQQYAMQPQKKSSKAWLWVLLILGAVILLCGGGFAGLMYIGIREQQRQEQANLIATNTTRTNSANSANTSTSTRSEVVKVDLARWEQDNSSYGDTTFEDGQFLMSSRSRGYYYALAGESKYKSTDSDARVSVTNLNSGDTTLGYGLVFHSDTTPLQKGYAFVIDTKKRRYRVVHHTPGKEESVVNWTTSTAINTGASPNILEIRDRTGSIDLYINDTKVNTIKNVHGAPNGVVGLYAADGIKIAFKDLEIRK